jgi:hypothetical protein
MFFGLRAAPLFTRIEEQSAPGFSTDLSHRDVATRGLTSPDISEWSTAFEDQPRQVW